MNYKTIGNTLTPGEFNAIQYLLNKNMSRTITIPISETITTEYGTIKTTFGAKYYKRKNGFITNSLKMKVIDPLFENMDYTIQLKYKTINDDLLDHDDDEETTTTYQLLANTEITITEATLDHIITNNAELTITFDKPVMQKTRTLTLNGTEFWTANTETIDITATILENTTPVPDVEVEFTTGSTTITETTGSDGVATYTYTGVKAGNLNYTVSAGGLTERFIIYDSKFHNQVFYNHYSRITVNNKTLTNTSGSDGYYLIDESGSATTLAQCYQYDPPFAILMRITEYTEGSRFFMYDGSHSFRPDFATLSPDKQEFVLRVEVSTDKVEYYVDGELREDLTWEDGTVGRVRGGFALINGASVTYEDVYLADINSATVGSVSLTGDKDILSYYDEDSVVLTATVLDEDDEAIEGVTVEFFNGSTSMGTATTNSSGVATKTYASAGVGDVTFTASVGSLVSETYVVEDCIFYDSCTSNAKASAWTIPSGVTSQYSENGWRISANAYKQIRLTDKLTSDCSVEFTLSDYSTPSGDNSPVIIYAYTNGETTPNQHILSNPSSSYYTVLDETKTGSLTKNGVYRIEYTSSTLKVYCDGTLLGSASSTVGLPTRFEIHQGANSRYAIYKDIKVKPL